MAVATQPLSRGLPQAKIGKSLRLLGFCIGAVLRDHGSASGTAGLAEGWSGCHGLHVSRRAVRNSLTLDVAFGVHDAAAPGTAFSFAIAHAQVGATLPA